MFLLFLHIIFLNLITFIFIKVDGCNLQLGEPHSSPQHVKHQCPGADLPDLIPVKALMVAQHPHT